MLCYLMIAVIWAFDESNGELRLMWGRMCVCLGLYLSTVSESHYFIRRSSTFEALVIVIPQLWFELWFVGALNLEL